MFNLLYCDGKKRDKLYDYFNLIEHKQTGSINNGDEKLTQTIENTAKITCIIVGHVVEGQLEDGMCEDLDEEESIAIFKEVY